MKRKLGAEDDEEQTVPIAFSLENGVCGLIADKVTVVPEKKRRRLLGFGTDKGGKEKPAHGNKTNNTSNLLSMLPSEVVALALSFINTSEDRWALQNTCAQFRNLTNSPEILRDLQLGGHRITGKMGIIKATDDTESALLALTPYAKSGNLEAMYMMGMIHCYCHQNVDEGVDFLKVASDMGFVRATYTLGLILRDSDKEKSSMYLQQAAAKGYLPALQETLAARDMKDKYGEPDADELRSYLDPICLNRLLGRYYLECSDLRGLNTSHCWNALCGRWAFKATSNVPQSMRNRSMPMLSLESLGEGRRSTRQRGRIANTSSRYVRAQASRGEEAQPQQTATASAPQRVSRMKMCSRCCRAKYCSKLCQVYDWRSGRHKMECPVL